MRELLSPADEQKHRKTKKRQRTDTYNFLAGTEEDSSFASSGFPSDDMVAVRTNFDSASSDDYHRGERCLASKDLLLACPSIQSSFTWNALNLSEIFSPPTLSPLKQQVSNSRLTNTQTLESK